MLSTSCVSKGLCCAVGGAHLLSEWPELRGQLARSFYYPPAPSVCSSSPWPQTGGRTPTSQDLVEWQFTSRLLWLLGPLYSPQEAAAARRNLDEVCCFFLCAKELNISSTPAILHPHSPPFKKKKKSKTKTKPKTTRHE